MESPFRAVAVALPPGPPGLHLIETLGWDGALFPRLDLHLDRLTQSAARLGWPCDRAAAATTLRAAAPPNAARMRLTLEAGGRIAVQAAALPPSPPVWRLGLAAARLASDDPWLTLKSSQRAAYDTARAALPEGLDEVIFANERGEVCDGSITTLFFDRGDGLCTPPLSAGLLPGVLRADLLARGQVREQGLAAAELPKLRLWIGNSLRGLMPALWVG